MDLVVVKSAAETGIVTNAVTNASATATILLQSQLNMSSSSEGN
jgi:hypothetical protein